MSTAIIHYITYYLVHVRMTLIKLNQARADCFAMKVGTNFYECYGNGNRPILLSNQTQGRYAYTMS